MIKNSGKLYIVSTPIGNLEDITLRALRILKEVDFIAAEDTRRTRKLLSHYDVETRITSCHAFNEQRKTGGILDCIEEGANVAVVSDCGTPAVSDPGFLIVREAVKRGIEPIVIPGPSSLTFAVAAAGLPVDSFVFYGFLPQKKGKRHRLLEEIAENLRTAVVFESPHRIARTLQEIADIIGDEVQLAVVREATKVYEETLRGSAKEILLNVEGKAWKGECVVVIAPKSIKLKV
jgi:16S rRNA (cytidine1402-2'-O)-methyltransferase